MKKIIVLLILLFPINVLAKEEFINISCDNYELKEFEQFACRTSISASFNYDKITFELENTNGLFLETIRSNHIALWNLSHENNIVTATTKNKELVNGLQEFGILLYSTTEYGEQEINIKKVVLINSVDNKSLEIKDSSKKMKVLSSENRLKEVKIGDEKIKNFSSDIFNYKINIDSNLTKVILGIVPIDENAKVLMSKEIELDANTKETIVPIKVISESGLSRVYKVVFIREEITDNNIIAAGIELKDSKGNIIPFDFKPSIFEYNLEFNSKINEINVKVLLDNENFSLVKDFGNQSVKIEKGDNIILIKIKDENNNLKTYTLNITQLLSNRSGNCYLKSLNIEDYDIKFNKRIKEYNLAIKKSVKKLNIKAVAEETNSKINILGNEDLKEGSIIKIVVKAENESKLTYQLKISYMAFNYNKIAIFGILIILILIFIKYGKKNNLLNKFKIKKNKKPAKKLKVKSNKKKNKNNINNYKPKVSSTKKKNQKRKKNKKNNYNKNKK